MAWALAAAGLLLALALAIAGGGRGSWGDEDTYVAMTASLARDGDLSFTESDRQRAVEREQGPPATVILQRVGSDISYSKPVVYPLLALPSYAIAGEAGMVALNVLLLAAALLVAWLRLRRLGSPGRAALTLVTFAACGVLPFYLGWRMSDVAQTALSLTGLVLVVLGLKAEGGRRSLALAAAGGLLLGLLAAMRLPGLALAAAAAAGGLVSGRRRAAVAVALAALLGFGLASGAGLALAGSANPYKEVRTSFSGETGYPIGEHQSGERFESRPATQSAGWLPRLDWTRSVYSAFYYMVGRHTGLLVYFPATLALLVAACGGREQRLGLALLSGPAAIALFYLLWMPDNYFGGSTFFGNRYFLMAYPALLAALGRLPSARSLALTWIVGLTVGASALVSMTAVVESAAESQSHTAAGLFRWLPSETTAREVDGFRGRYWGADFVRFVDPFAADDEKRFRLAAGAPAAEMELAFRVPRHTLRLVIDAGPAGGELLWRDWRGGGSRALVPGPQGIELPLAPAWRHHTYWWQVPDVYQVRSIRLAFRSQAGGEAVVRYVGGPFRRRGPRAGGSANPPPAPPPG